MFRIWKFPIETSFFSLDLPVNSKVVHVEAQYPQPTTSSNFLEAAPHMWVHVPGVQDEYTKIEQRHFYAVATGDEVPDHYNYVASFTVTERIEGTHFMYHSLVFHLCEKERS